MINTKMTIRSQLIGLLVLSVLMAQIPIATVFLGRADAISDVYEENFQIEKIASTYRAISEAPTSEQGALIQASSGLDLSFSLSPEPKFTNTLENQDHVEWFSQQIHDVEIGYEAKEIGALDQWYFWFSDQDELCFQVLLAQELETNCPYQAFSLKISDDQWLNALSGMASDGSVILVPVFMSAGITLLGFVVVIVFAIRRVTAPLRELEKAAEKLGTGQYVEQLAANGPKELATTASAFNVMQERLSRFVHDRTEMLAAISHDLRTPITSLRIQVEFVENISLRENMIRILDDMQAMVESCLSFAHQDIVEEESGVVDIVEFVKKTSKEFKNASFSTSIDSCLYSCRRVGLGRAMRNIIENSIKYGDSAMVNVLNDNDNILIEISDNGPGIPDDKIEDIFEPFVRLDASRNVQTGSVGLGLTIARTIIHGHGGEIRAKNIYPGLRMSISLPMN